MLAPTCITVPGLHGSGPDHWQTWAEKEIPNCRRVSGIDFDKPVIAAWADAIRNNIRDEVGSVILIAHSFGCLASVVAIKWLGLFWWHLRLPNDSVQRGLSLRKNVHPLLYSVRFRHSLWVYQVYSSRARTILG